jgi:hypothetical protein
MCGARGHHDRVTCALGRQWRDVIETEPALGVRGGLHEGKKITSATLQINNHCAHNRHA